MRARPSMSLFALACAFALGGTAAGKEAAAPSGPTVGEAPPAFTLTDTDGKTVKLSDYAGKVVVLEWFNPDCPFVKYAHGEGPLKAQGNNWAKKGVVWLAINSGAAGKQGAGKERNVEARKEYGMDYPVLLDENGATGKAYAAKTTPHMYVIDSKGKLVYMGAIDNAPLGKVDGDKLMNYVDLALEAVLAGKKVATSQTKSYGCSVKYGS
jgi:peroxiredoxin